MSVAQKLKRARTIQPGRPTQEAVADLLGLPVTKYKSLELGRVTGDIKVDPVVQKLSATWNINQDWFYDGRNSDPYEGKPHPALVKLRRVRVYYAAELGRPAYTAEASEIRMIDADVAALDPLSVELPDDRMAPRFASNWVLYAAKGRRLIPGKPYLAVHKTKKVKVGEDEAPEVVIGVYVVRDGARYLEPPNQPKLRELIHELDDISRVVAQSYSLTGDDAHMIVEKNLRDGLSMEPLPVTLGPTARS